MFGGSIFFTVLAVMGQAPSAHAEAIDAARSQVTTLFRATMEANPRAAESLAMPEMGTGHHASYVRELPRGTLSVSVNATLHVLVNQESLQLSSYQWQYIHIPRPAGFDDSVAESLHSVEAQRIAEQVLQDAFQLESPIQLRLLETERNYTYKIGLFVEDVQLDPGFMYGAVDVDRFSGLPTVLSGMPQRNILLPELPPERRAVGHAQAREAALGAQLVTEPHQQIVVSSRLTYSTLRLIRNQVERLEPLQLEQLEQGYALLVYRIDILAANQEGFPVHQVVYVDAYRGETLGLWSFDESTDGIPAVYHDLRLDVDRDILNFVLRRNLPLLRIGHQAIPIYVEPLESFQKTQDDFADLDDVESDIRGYLRIQKDVYVLAEVFPDREVIRVKGDYYAIHPRQLDALQNVQMPNALPLR